MKKFYRNLILVAATLALVTGCSSSATSDDNKDSEKTKEVEETTEKETTKKNYYGLGDTFTFDDLEITMGTEITFVTLDNQYSDLNGSTIAKIPVTVKNLKDETYKLNLFYINIFGSQGTELESVSSYFLDDSVDFAGDLRPEASYTKYLYALYDGNGTYAIEFDDFISDKITVEFEINQ